MPKEQKDKNDVKTEMFRDLKIRASEEKDIDDLERIFQKARQCAFKWHSPDKFKIGNFKKSTEGEVVWVALLNKKIVGFVSVWTQDNFLHNLFVDPDYQGHGIGKKLLIKAQETYSRPMELKVDLLNDKARDFYRRQGWQEISVHKDAPDPYILMRLSN